MAAISLYKKYIFSYLHPQMSSVYVTFLGDHNWLQSDAAFVYPRLDKYSLSVGMFWSTCCLSRSPLGRLATASSLAGNVS